MTNKLDVVKNHFEAATIVTDIYDEVGVRSDSFTIAVMFTVSPNDQPCKIVRLTHGKSDIIVPTSATPACDAEYFRDCFRVTQINKLLLFTDEHMFLFDDESLSQFQKADAQTIHPPVEFIRCCEASTKGSSILLACKVYEEFVDEFNDL